MLGRSTRAVLAALGFPLADAVVLWYLAPGNVPCEQACTAAGNRGEPKMCVPKVLPDSAIKMWSTAEGARVVCDNIKRVGASDTAKEALAPYFEPPTAGNALPGGTCWYPRSTKHSKCAEAPATRAQGDMILQRFCPCSEVTGMKYLLSNAGDNCDKTCEESGGMCANEGPPTLWPKDADAMTNVIEMSGAPCTSASLGVSDADPSLTSTGTCRWAKTRGIAANPLCSTSEQGLQRFCPCYDIATQSQSAA